MAGLPKHGIAHSHHKSLLGHRHLPKDSGSRLCLVSGCARNKPRIAADLRLYLAELRNNATGALYWRTDAATASGQLAAYTLGNGIAGTHGYDPLTGRLHSQQAGGGAVQSVAYGYDAVGNLTYKSDVGSSTATPPRVPAACARTRSPRSPARSMGSPTPASATTPTAPGAASPGRASIGPAASP